jgi:hypothetical protein
LLLFQIQQFCNLQSIVQASNRRVRFSQTSQYGPASNQALLAINRLILNYFESIDQGLTAAFWSPT